MKNDIFVTIEASGIGTALGGGAAAFVGAAAFHPMALPALLVMGTGFGVAGVGEGGRVSNDMSGNPMVEEKSNQPLSFSERQAEKRNREKIDGVIKDSKEATPYTKMNDKSDRTMSSISKNMLV